MDPHSTNTNPYPSSAPSYKPSAPYDNFDPVPFQALPQQQQQHQQQPHQPYAPSPVVPHQQPIAQPPQPPQKTQLKVTLVSFCKNMGKKHRTYSFMVSVREDTLFQFGDTHSKLEDKFGKKRSGPFLCGQFFPPGPSLFHRETSTTAPLFGQKLETYFSALLNKGGDGSHLMDPSFLEAFGINPAQRSVFATLETIAAEMKAASDAKKAAFEHYKNGLERLRDHAQSFNSIHACNALPPTHVPSLTFDSEMELCVKMRNLSEWSRGYATIFGPGDLKWLKASPEQGSSTRCGVHIHVTTRTGLPLLQIKQEGDVLSTYFSLSRYDPRTMTYKLACTINFPMKMQSTFYSTPVVKSESPILFDLVPEPTLQVGPLGGGVITNGSLPHDGVIKGKLGGDLATVSEAWRSSGMYNMKVTAGVDVLIMIGVVILLDLVSPQGYRERARWKS